MSMSSASEIFVKVYIKDQQQYIKINRLGENWTYEDFLLSIGIYADIPVLDIACLCDSCGIEIPKENFVNIFMQNYIHPEYCLKIKMKKEPLRDNTVPGALSRHNCRIGHDMFINVEELEKYILKSQNAYVLIKKNKQDDLKELPSLSDVERRAVIREGVSLLVRKFSYHPEHEHKLALAVAIIKLFPQLDTHNKDTGGVDLLYNREHNRGYILSRLNHIRNKLYKIENNKSNQNFEIIKKKRLNCSEKDKKNIKESNAGVSCTNDYEEDFIILKNLNTNTQKDFIKQKLLSTLDYRQNYLQNKSMPKVSEAFPFFFTSPDLILYDFNLRFPTHSSSFIDDWPKVAAVVEKVWIGFKGPTTSKILELDEWTQSYQRILFLLNLLPQTASGRSSAKIQRIPFDESINRLILFKNLNLTNEELKESGGSSPYLIAKGENKKAITSLLLCVESELIPLPTQFNVIDGIDILFKAHYICNQEFDESVKNFWLFISHYFFKIDKKVPTKIKDVANKISMELNKNNGT